MTVTDTPPADVPAPPPAEPSIAKLAAALARVQVELPPIRKAETGEVSGTNKDGKFFSYKYSYADLAAVSAAIMPLLGKNGLSFTSWPSTTPRGFMLRYYLLHESGEQMAGEYPLPTGERVTAQQLGSAITYARRYCLCAVTGVAPDDDDDAAAADGAKAQQRAEQHEELDAELSHARDEVRGAWATQYGPFDQAKAGEMFKAWSKGTTLLGATAGQLRAFAGYIHAQPAADAGSEPTVLPPAENPATDKPPAEPRKMTKLQQGKLFALFSDIGYTAAADQRSFLSKALEREIKSRSELTVDDAKIVIDILEEAVSGPAAGAQSASGETRVPAGPETPPEDGGR